MDAIERILSDVPKDSFGFEDLDRFWLASDKISFPLQKRVKNRLFERAKTDIQRSRLSFSQSFSSFAQLNEESDSDFDYDTSSTISMEIEELIEEVINEPEPEPDQDDEDNMGVAVTEEPSAVSAANLETSLNSIQLTPVSSPPETSKELSKMSTRGSNKKEDASNDRSITTVGDLEDTIPKDNDLSYGARGDKSSLVSDKSMVEGRTSVSSLRTTRSAAKNKTPLTVEQEPKMPPSSIKKSTRNSIERRVSFEPSIELTPGASTIGDMSTVKEDSHQHPDTSIQTPSTLSSTLKGTPSDKSNKSLSSALEPIGSPINKSLSTPLEKSSRMDEEDSEASKATVPNDSTLNDSRMSKKSITSKSSTRSKTRSQVSSMADEDSHEEDISTVAISTASKSTLNVSEEQEPEESINVTKSTVQSSHVESPSKEDSELAESAAITTPAASELVTSGREDEEPTPIMMEDAPPDMYDEEPPSYTIDAAAEDYVDESAEKSNRASISRISATEASPTSMPEDEDQPLEDEVDGGEKSSVRFTPQTKTKDARKSTPGSAYTVAISTPGSNEFPRGIRLRDESFHVDDSDAPTDDDIETDKEMDTTFYSDKKDRKYGEDDDDENVIMDVEESNFIDSSYLNTISSANKDYAGKRLREETKQLKKEQKAKELEKLKKRKKVFLASSSEEESDAEDRSKSSDRSEELEDLENSEDFEDDEIAMEHGLRRSRRATKGRRWAFWKGERPVYKEGTVVGLIKAAPTPKRPARLIKNNNNNKRKRSTTTQESSETDESDENLRLISDNSQVKKKKQKYQEQEEELPPIDLPSNTTFLTTDQTDSIEIWDSYYEQIVNDSVVRIRKTLPPPQALPRNGKRPPGKNGVGVARHLFNVPERPGVIPGWIAGYMDLPAQAIKDPENVGVLAQVFFVMDCQEGSLEFGLASPEEPEWNDRKAQRVLLSAGDSFYVPPGNVYRLENHSKVKEAKMTWMVIKPMQELDPTIASSNMTQVASIQR